MAEYMSNPEIRYFTDEGAKPRPNALRRVVRRLLFFASVQSGYTSGIDLDIWEHTIRNFSAPRNSTSSPNSMNKPK